jgi:hypothetical protein
MRAVLISTNVRSAEGRSLIVERHFEGLVAVLKREILLLQEKEGWNPQGKRMQLLTEQSQLTSDNGKVHTVPYYVPLSRSIP